MVTCSSATKTAAAASVVQKKKPTQGSSAGSAAAASSERSKYQYIADAMRQDLVHKSYHHPFVQWGIAALIMGNFATNIIEKQIDPWNKRYPDQWKIVETAWNLIFIVELVWNAYGSWYLSTWKGHFLCSGWNIFDVIVVSISIPSLIGANLGTFSQLRMLRAFRVFRLFKRIKSLNKIIVSLSRAVPGIVNAAILQLIVMCIYSILAVDLFGEYGADGQYTNIDGETIPMITMRGMTYGDEYYGTFFRSLFTLFQVLTGESWAEAVARPVVFTEGHWPYVSGIFYVTYILLCGIVLVNVAVAVLLEKMVDVEESTAEDAINIKDMPEHAQLILMPLDTDGDGVITKEEMLRAAEFLRHDPNGGEESIIKQLADATRSEMRTCIHTEMLQTQNDIKQLREETASREGRLLEALSAAAQREAVLQASLQTLSTTMEKLTAVAAGRPRRGKALARVGAATAATTPVSVNGVGTPTSDEDKEQDGERLVSKQAPERLQHV